MIPDWLDELEVLADTEHFKLVLDDTADPSDSFERGATYLIVYKPLNQIEQKYPSITNARLNLWLCEETFEQTEKLFELDASTRGGSEPEPGNRLN